VKRKLVAIAIALVGGAVVAGLSIGQSPALASLDHVRWLGLTIGSALIAAAVLILFASGRASAPLMSLNWFLPVLRKQRAGEPALGVMLPWIRRWLPRGIASDRTTKKRGLVRRGLRRIGASWLSAPVRRAVQAVCLTLFLSLFFWVCWPYDASPAPPGEVSADWRLDEVGHDGNLWFTADSNAEWIDLDDSVYLAAPNSATDGGYLAHLTVASINRERLELQLVSELTVAQFDLLLTSNHAWTLHEREPGAWPSHYADRLEQKEFVPADIFLAIDPLVSLSTAIASRSWIWSLVSAAAILTVCVLIPRGFCGYLCPLGALIDLFDWAIGKRITRFRVPATGWWVHIKYYLLLGTLVSALFGVLISGYVAAIPVITRGMLFIGEPLQSGAMRGWHLVPAFNAGHIVSIAMFIAVLGLGLLRPRFWCKYVCPSGATFSLANLFRANERKVESTCIQCDKCVEVCPFDAIKPDFTTRVTDCTLCQTCGGVCPTHAIKFVDRWDYFELKVENDPPTGETAIGRRGFLSLAASAAAAVTGGATFAVGAKAWGANLDDPSAPRPIRPPGSVPEQEFLEMCIRCGECFKVCPNNVLQAEGFQQGLEGLWAPLVEANWAGCESSCNACGQVCPTGAIRSLPIEEKKVARMGLAIVNDKTCLPLIGKEECDLCVQECDAAGYHAIEYMQVHTQVDDLGQPVEGSGFLAPVVLADKCVGCGLCQTRCYGINAKAKKLLTESAIVIEVGEGKEDRLMTGSYIELREQESRRESNNGGDGEFFLPSDPPMEPKETTDPDDPFGVDPKTPDGEKTDPFGLDASP
jgi:ferredoxin